MSKQEGIDKQILKDIKKKVNKAIKNMSEDIGFEVERRFESAIEWFYRDYSPRYYDRTYSTYEASSGYDDYSSLSRKIAPYTYQAGINVSSSNITGNPYRADKDWVFNRTYNLGIHGFTKHEDQERQLLDIAVQAIQGKAKKITIKATRYAKIGEIGDTLYIPYKTKETYWISDVKAKKAPRQMLKNYRFNEKSGRALRPRIAMDKWWKEYTKRENMRKMFTRYLNSEFYFDDKYNL